MSPFLFLAALCGSAAAQPGIHPPSVSTWDSRASSLVFAHAERETARGDVRLWNYNANFSSTNGRLSSQFGLHYAQRGTGSSDTAYGGSVSIVTSYAIPLASRFDNGVPKVAIAPYVGPVPTVLASARAADVWVPLVVGAGLSLSPAPWVTLTPSVEGAFALEFAGRLRPGAVRTLSSTSASDWTEGGEPTVGDVLDDAVQTSLRYANSARVEALLELHLSNRLGLAGRAGLGPGGRDGWAPTLGASLVIHWDRVVPAVLPTSG